MSQCYNVYCDFTMLHVLWLWHCSVTTCTVTLQHITAWIVTSQCVTTCFVTSYVSAHTVTSQCYSMYHECDIAMCHSKYANVTLLQVVPWHQVLQACTVTSQYIAVCTVMSHFVERLHLMFGTFKLYYVTFVKERLMTKWVWSRLHVQPKWGSTKGSRSNVTWQDA